MHYFGYKHYNNSFIICWSIGSLDVILFFFSLVIFWACFIQIFEECMMENIIISGHQYLISLLGKFGKYVSPSLPQLNILSNFFLPPNINWNQESYNRINSAVVQVFTIFLHLKIFSSSKLSNVPYKDQNAAKFSLSSRVRQGVLEFFKSSWLFFLVVRVSRGRKDSVADERVSVFNS